MMREPARFPWLAAGVLITAVGFMMAPNAGAIPTWARKYRTSCQTCHLVFPYLTPFGEAFRHNGYRFPEGGDESFREEDTVSLGAEAYKKLFPEAVWPADLAAVPPVSFLFESEVGVTLPGVSNRQADVDFNNLGAGAEILVGGTVGEDISYFAEFEFVAPGPDDVVQENAFERVWAEYAPFGPQARVKVGEFEPGVLNTTQHRRLTAIRPAATRLRFFDNEWSLDGAQRGFEFTGVVGEGRVGYAVGVVEGNRNPHHRSKDYYGSLFYKFGGMRVDGAVPDGEDPTGSSKPWSERSATVQIFAYKGTAALTTAGPNNQSDQFWNYGGDVRTRFDDLIVDAGLIGRADTQPSVANPGDRAKAWVAFGEADYVIFPWLVPSLRWDHVAQESLPGSPRDHSDIYAVSLNVLLRSNVRLQGSYQRTTHPNELSGIGTGNQVLLFSAQIGV